MEAPESIRDVFNGLTLALVRACLKSKAGKRDLALWSRQRVIDRHSLSTVLWEAERNIKDELGVISTGRIDVRKNSDGDLVVEILDSRKPRTVSETILICTKPTKTLSHSVRIEMK